jgi:hypothetical protein
VARRWLGRPQYGRKLPSMPVLGYLSRQPAAVGTVTPI